MAPPQLNPKFLAERIRTVGFDLIVIINRYQRFESAYGVKFDKFWAEAMDLIVRERRFGEGPSVAGSQELDAAWDNWSKGLITELQDARLELQFDDEKHLLKQFVDARTMSRLPLL